VLRSSGIYGWSDGDTPAQELLSARLRAKYYGGEYIILRPYIYNALKWQEDILRRPEPPFDCPAWLQEHKRSEKLASTNTDAFEDIDLPRAEITVALFESNPAIAEQFLWCCKRCIDAAVYSTWAFDGVADPKDGQRPRVTNIHGTATA
jgi:hypothetical protein